MITPALTITHPSPLCIYAVISAIPAPGTTPFSWFALKMRADIAGGDEEQKELEQQFRAITDQAMIASMSEDSTADGMADAAFAYEDLKQEVITPNQAAPANQCNKYEDVEMSKSVLKWLGVATPEYHDTFWKRIDRLASGDRTYALAKRLQGSESLIYESKLFGFRILWTPIMRDDSKVSRIFIWFVSTHDKVSDYAERIDSSFTRMDKKPQLCSWDRASESTFYDDQSPAAEPCNGFDQYLRVTEDTVLLDPLRNTALKVHTTSSDKLSMIAGEERWIPPLRLTQKQRDIKDVCESVLILGRSGELLLTRYLLYLLSCALHVISHVYDSCRV